MILLLRGVGDRSSLPELRRCAEHPDLRVRLEAIKSLFLFDPGLPAELLRRAIHDPDPTLAESAVMLAGTCGITQAVQPILEVLRRWDLRGRRRGLRLKALRALARLGDPAALPALERFFAGGWLPPVARAERRAAFATLGAYPEPHRRPLIARGLRSRDAAIRAICERLERGGGDPSLDETHV
jgi:HEAT repeat protein